LVEPISGELVHQSRDRHMVNLNDQKTLIESELIENSIITRRYRIEFSYHHNGGFDLIENFDSSQYNTWQKRASFEYHRDLNGRLDSLSTYHSSQSGSLLSTYDYENGQISGLQLFEFDMNGLRKKTGYRTYDSYDQFGNCLTTTEYGKLYVDWVDVRRDSSAFDRKQRLTMHQVTEGRHSEKHVYEYQALPPTSMAEVSSSPNVRLFPNPVSDILNIQTDVDISSIQVYDLLGNIKMSIDSYSNDHTNMGHLSTGTYLLRFKGKDSVRTTKVVKL